MSLSRGIGLKKIPISNHTADHKPLLAIFGDVHCNAVCGEGIVLIVEIHSRVNARFSDIQGGAQYSHYRHCRGTIVCESTRDVSVERGFNVQEFDHSTRRRHVLTRIHKLANIVQFKSLTLRNKPTDLFSPDQNGVKRVGQAL